MPLLFVLAVLFYFQVHRRIYLWGSSSMIAVVGVNYVFTYPYFAVDFTITGYPVTSRSMLAVACGVSALTTQIKKQEQIRLEAEKEKMRGLLFKGLLPRHTDAPDPFIGAASVVLEVPGSCITKSN